MSAIFATAPARATADAYVKVLLPLEEMMEGGYCQQEVIAHDAVVTSGNAFGQVLSRVLTRPVEAFVYHGGPEGESLDINPLSKGQPKLKLRIESQHELQPIYKISVGIDDYGISADSEKTATKIKLAFVYALRNIFTWHDDAKVTFSIDGAVLKDAELKPLSSLAAQPHTKTSPVYRAIADELRSKMCSNVLPNKSWSE